jgi:ketosteroid isomerase-like protein
MTDEQQIRDLIEVWATAVHAGDLPAVLANHAPDIVMFDVPPPEQGVRGLDAYRDTWPGFFEWQASGAVFEIESLDVTAAADVAFAFALLRCGTPADFERDPERRLQGHRTSRPPRCGPCTRSGSTALRLRISTA